jgi:predicted secreted protein
MAIKPPKGKSLAEVNPELAKQWHLIRNGDLTPFDVSAGSHNKVWWKCSKGDDHEWEASIKSRNNGNGCPICVNQKIVFSNCLATLNPQLAKEWHPTKNGDLSPFDVSENSGKKVWWKCPEGDDHEWEASIGSRSNGTGCPVCQGQKIVLSNCLATLNSQLAKEWHPTKNGDLSPFDVSENSGKKVWWKCPKGDDHEWEASIGHRVKGSGCGVCSSHTIVKSNCLATLNPQLAKEWHPTKNGDLTAFDVSLGSNKKVWWKCPKGGDHEWEAVIANRVKGSGCGVCSGHRIVKSNCLSTLNPQLAKEWHPTKNGDLTAFDVSLGSDKKVWWKCPKGDDHEWEASIGHRVKDSGCGVCSSHTIVKSNCLATTHPEIANQWHPTLNQPITPKETTKGRTDSYWWKCNKADDHIWEASPNTRTSGRNCPFCTLTPQSRQELTITFELIQFFKDINPKGFKTRVKGKLWSIDIYIPQLKLGIEFDGSYWHKGKRQLDKLKTIQLKEEGFAVIRIREQSKVATLKKITKNDVISKMPFNGKEVANNVLKQIMEMYELDTKKIAKIQSYISKKELQNEKGLDKYIDMILTEKAEKKK